MNKQTTICTDPETLAKLRAKAPGGNVSAYLRDISNGGPYLTIYDLAMEMQELRKAIMQNIMALGNTLKVPGDDN